MKREMLRGDLIKVYKTLTGKKALTRFNTPAGFYGQYAERTVPV